MLISTKIVLNFFFRLFINVQVQTCIVFCIIHSQSSLVLSLLIFEFITQHHSSASFAPFVEQLLHLSQKRLPIYALLRQLLALQERAVEVNDRERYDSVPNARNILASTVAWDTSERPRVGMEVLHDVPSGGAKATKFAAETVEAWIVGANEICDECGGW